MKKNKNISPKTFSKIIGTCVLVLFLFFLFLSFEIYIPINPLSAERITYDLKKGKSVTSVSQDLEQLGLIRSSNFLKFYLAGSLKYANLKAGRYLLSPQMSAYQMTKKMVEGDTLKTKITILEGWNLNMVAQYLDSLNICKPDEFMQIGLEDWSQDFDFLREKPENINLEGYIFPDTYEFEISKDCRDVIGSALNNFSRKLTPELRSAIQQQNKSIFDIVVMASILEKEVRTFDDKKMVSGILWKRLSVNMPLQIDATVNYVTGKNTSAVSLEETQIDSLYNTYKYKGLPAGPISNPGLDSIMAAIYPTKNDYWYFLTDGKTIFSKTLEEHNIAKVKYLKNGE